jgi:hypothetical protein
MIMLPTEQIYMYAELRILILKSWDIRYSCLGHFCDYKRAYLFRMTGRLVRPEVTTWSLPP